MKLLPYKPRQGKYARYAVAGAIAVLLLFAAWRMTRFIGFGRPFSLLGMSVPHGAIWGAGVFLIMGCLAAVFIGGFRTGWKAFDATTASCVDLLIDTENELQKVAWPGREELRRYTIVVIACTLVIGGLIYSADVIISTTMRSLGVLPFING